MTRIGPARLTFRGLQLVPGVSALIALLVLVGVFLAVGAPRQTNGTLSSALHESLATSGGAVALTTDVTGGTNYDPTSEGRVVASLWPHVPSRLADIEKGLSGLGDIVQPAEFVGTARGAGNGFPGSGTPTIPSKLGNPSYTIEAAPSLRSEARLASGRWPGPVAKGKPLEVVIAAKAAAALHWKVGQTQTLEGASTVAGQSFGQTVTLVGTVAPRDATSAFWSLSFDRAQLRTVVNPDGTSSYFGRVWVDPASWPKLAPTLSGLDISAWYGFDTDAISADQATSVAAKVRAFIAEQSGLAARSSSLGLIFKSQLPADLDAFAQRSGSSTALIALFELGPAGALAAVLFLGLGLLQTRRARVEDLLRARGGSAWQLRMLAAAEVAAWTLPAAVVGAALAVVFTPGLGSLGTAIFVAVVCGLVPPIAAAVLAEQFGSRARRSIVARAAGPVAQASVVLVAALVLVVLVARGPVTATSQVDPLVELAPLLLAIAVTVVVIRLVPFGARRLSSVMQRGRGAVNLVAASGGGAARRGAPWALFALVVGVGMAVFSLSMVATQREGVEQAALNQVGSDVVISGTNLSGHTVTALEHLPGVAAHATIQNLGEDSINTSNVSVYSVDPKALAAVQSGIHDSSLSAVRGSNAVVADVNNPPATAQLGATGQTLLRLHRSDAGTVSFVLADQNWLLVDSAEVPKSGVFPSTVGVLLRLRPGADPAVTATDARRLAGTDSSVRTAAQAGSAIVDSPLQRTVQFTIVAATSLAALLCLIVFVMTLAAGAADRLRRGAILRALGFSRRQTASLVFADVIPSAVLGVVVGALTGVGLAAVVLHTIDATAFIGAPIPMPLVVDFPSTALVLVGFLVAAAVAGATAVMLDLVRPSTAGLQTLGEER